MKDVPPSHFTYDEETQALCVYLQHPDADKLDAVKNLVEPRTIPGLRVHMGWDNSAVALEIHNVVPDPTTREAQY